MNRNSAISKVSILSLAEQTPIKALARPGEYLLLIRSLFHGPSAVAIVNSGSGLGARDLCEDIAAELAGAGKRVVVVAVDTLLHLNPLTVPDETALMPGRTPNVWLWPLPAGQQIEPFESSEAAGAGSWLNALRRNFDSVLLDCPAVEVMPGVTEVAALADAAVLVVEAGRTRKQKIQRDQRAFQLRGVQLTGCILIRRR